MPDISEFHEIQHSGRTWRSLGQGKEGGYPIWPIEEYLARRHHGPAVAKRIARLNPNGKEEGLRPRGWHPHACLSWMTGVDGEMVSDFIAQHGRKVFRAIPKSAFMKVGGRRKLISRQWLIENGH